MKKAYIRSDVYAAGSTIGQLKVYSMLYAVGLGYRFRVRVMAFAAGLMAEPAGAATQARGRIIRG